MNIAPYENLTPEELQQNKIRLLRIPKSVHRIMLHIKAFHDNYGGLFPNRILMSESFARELAYDLVQSIDGHIRFNGQPIVRPDTYIFNMRVHIVPDEYLPIPFEVSCGMEMILPTDMAYIARRRMKLAEYYSSKYASIDFANHIALPAL